MERPDRPPADRPATAANRPGPHDVLAVGEAPPQTDLPCRDSRPRCPDDNLIEIYYAVAGAPKGSSAQGELFITTSPATVDEGLHFSTFELPGP